MKSLLRSRSLMSLRSPSGVSARAMMMRLRGHLPSLKRLL